MVLAFMLQWSICSTATCQGFSHRYDPLVSDGQFGWCIEQIGSGQYVVIGNMPWVDSLYYPSSVVSLLLDSNGEMNAEHRFDIPLKASYPGWSNSGVLLADGRLALCGGTQDTSGSNRAAIFWLEGDSEPIGYVEIQPTPNGWIGYQLKSTPDGGFILTGVTTATGVQDIFLLKTDSLGNVEWWQTYGHPTRLDYSATVDLAPNGGYYIGGLYPQTASGFVQWVLRTDSVGGLLWEVFRGIPVDETPNAAVLSTTDGNLVYASGKHSGGPDEEHWPQLVKLDTAGNEIWDKTYGEAVFGTGFFSVAEVSSSGDLIACGQKWYQTDGGFPYRKGILVRANSEGDSLWMREYFYYDSVLVDCQGVFRDVQPTPDGGFVVVGETRGNINGNNPPGLSVDVWVVKVDSLGCIEPGCNIPLGITTQITNMGYALTLHPVPLSPSKGEQLHVGIHLPANFKTEGPLALTVVSMEGKWVRQGAVPTSAPNEVVLDVTGLAPGAYTVHLSDAHTWIAGKKFVVE